MQDPILAVKNITKTYPGVVALNNVSMTFEKGEVHALLGENGAGKSTLIKIISGAIEPDRGQIVFNNKEYKKMTPGLARECGVAVIYQGETHCLVGENGSGKSTLIKIISGAIEPDRGQIVFNNKEYKKMTPGLARECGVAVIYQEFSLVESLSVAQNVFLGEHGGVLINYGDLKRRAAQIFTEMNVKIDPSAKVMKLSPAQKQLVEIAKAISRNARLLIMDEPSAPLSASDVETMFEIIGQLKNKGVTIIYISHRIEELFRISDRVTVMRDGRYIDTLVTKQTNRKELINLMVGREMKEYYPKRTGMPGEVALEVKNLYGLGDRDISFSIRKGEILGVAGLVGSGRTELASIIYGASPKESGETWIEGQKREIHSPNQAIEYGIGLIPEDRKRHGCILNASVHFNISLSTFNKNARFFVVDSKAQKKTAAYYVEKFNIKTPSMEQRVQNLSGGNQQKVIMAKTLAANTNILIFDEPTRGIDVGSKQEIYNLMIDLVNQGKTILMISSEMEELLGMADRLIVLCEGRFMGEIPKEKFDQRTIIELASGHH